MVQWIRPGPANVVALATVAGVLIVLAVHGKEMFSPGPLRAQVRSQEPLGGVSSHAAIGNNCAACHVSPWSKETMASRCLDCHKDVKTQLDAGGSLHGRFANGGECRSCHTEHKGPHGVLTNLARFDHDCAAFQLTGKHQTTECKACHTTPGVYKGTAKTCFTCHAEPVVHKEKYGTTCSQCHSTSTWDGAVIRHTGFSMTHGGRNNTCATCHNVVAHFSTYTCYNCHEHTPAKIERTHSRRRIANLNDCTRCHGRNRNRRAAGEMELGGMAEVCQREGRTEPEPFLALLRSLDWDKGVVPVSRDAEPRSGAAERVFEAANPRSAAPLRGSASRLTGFSPLLPENKLFLPPRSVMLE